MSDTIVKENNIIDENTKNKSITKIKNEIKSHLEEIVSLDPKEDKSRIKQLRRISDNKLKEVMELINFALITKDPFFAHFSMKLERRIDYNLPAPMGVSLYRGFFKLHINPLLLVPYTVSEIIAILKHEIYHIMHLHIVRGNELKNIPHSIKNIGFDAAINQRIDGLPKGTVTLDMIKGFIPHYTGYVDYNREGEYYIKLLVENMESQSRINMYSKMSKQLNRQGDDGSGTGQGESGDQDEEGQGGSGKGDEQNEQDKEGQGNGNSKKDLDENKGKGLSNHDAWEKEKSDVDLDDMEEVVKDMMNDAIEKSRGKAPSHVKELIESMNKPPQIPWQKVFKMMVGSIKVPFKRTPLRRSRRQPDRYDVRGRISDRTVKVAVAIDTSGSMTQRELSYAFTELFNILKNVKYEMIVIECDARVQRHYKVKNKKQVDLEVRGRGGTVFTPVFTYIREEFKDNIDMLIYFTDGYGESELADHHNNRYKLMWVLTNNNKYLSLDDPKGLVKPLRMDE